MSAIFQIVVMMKGWAKFMYEDKVTLVEAGDVVHQRPGHGATTCSIIFAPIWNIWRSFRPPIFGSVEAAPPATDKGAAHHNLGNKKRAK